MSLFVIQMYNTDVPASQQAGILRSIYATFKITFGITPILPSSV